jgi:LysR family transcriptional regulator, low CO2-responsive transcriptional regulator
MTLHQLKIFQAVATYLSETKAAQDIRIRQPSVSKQLKLLEQSLKVQLHVRQEQGIKLTEEGRLFLKAIEPILEQVDYLESMFSETTRKMKPALLKVGGSQSPSALMLPQAFNDFKRTHPHAYLTLRIGEAPMVEQMVVHREVEIGVITSPCTNPKLASELLCSEPVVGVVASKHPLAKKSKVTLEELGRVPVVVKMGGRISRQLEKMGLKLNVAMQCEPIDAMKSAVESGVGMGFFYHDLVKTDLKKGYLKAIKIPLLKQLQVRWFVIYSNQLPLSRDGQDFVALLHQTATKCHAVPVNRDKREQQV